MGIMMVDPPMTSGFNFRMMDHIMRNIFMLLLLQDLIKMRAT